MDIPPALETIEWVDGSRDITLNDEHDKPAPVTTWTIAQLQQVISACTQNYTDDGTLVEKVAVTFPAGQTGLVKCKVGTDATYLFRNPKPLDWDGHSPYFAWEPPPLPPEVAVHIHKIKSKDEPGLKRGPQTFTTTISGWPEGSPQ